MIHGLNDYEKLKVIRPLLGDHIYDDQNMPVMHKVTEDMIDLEHAVALNLQNLNARHNNTDKLVLPFNYDKDLMRYWNDPLKYIPVLQTAMAVGTPDYSVYSTMNRHEIEHNVYKNRWLGCLWQTYGCVALPTIAWATPDTFDICFSGTEYGTIVIISTVGCTEHLSEFMCGYDEMMVRINPPLVIVYGDMLPGMYGRFLHFKYTDAFNKKATTYKQQTLFEMSPIFERKRGA